MISYYLSRAKASGPGRRARPTARSTGAARRRRKRSPSLPMILNTNYHDAANNSENHNNTIIIVIIDNTNNIAILNNYNYTYKCIPYDMLGVACRDPPSARSPRETPLRDMGAAPRNQAPRSHFLAWIVEPPGCHCTDALGGEKHIVECQPLLGALPPSSDPHHVSASLHTTVARNKLC